ncbi:MAG: UDP-N-acetylmuramyl-tripeptide synthetase [Patescibacteria group bacterium]
MNRLKSIYHYIVAVLAYVYYGRPARKLIVIGVTGTKGKSSTARFIAEVLRAGGNKVGLLSTVEFQIADKRILNDKKMTMLGRGQIQKMLREMVLAGCKYAVVETSSEGILQYRHIGLDYDVCVFTNLGTEHSERHGGFTNLRRDKGKIFAGLMKQKRKIIDGQEVAKIIVANLDDENAEYFLQFNADKKKTFGLEKPAEVFGKIISTDANGTTMECGGAEYNIYIPGMFNVYNALASVAVGHSFDIHDTDIAKGISSVKLIEGRMESIDVGQPFKVLVDYAHEPMSLTELFKTARQMVGAQNKVIAVIGSDGGGRDKSKREFMGEVAGQMCDTVVITDVNCFDEDPDEIIKMLAVGAIKAGKFEGQDLFSITDRREGINKAITLAKPGDIVLITAKGTEPCMVFAKGRKIPWDDRRVAKEILQSINFDK